MNIYLLAAKAPNHGFSDWPDAVRRTRAGQTYRDSWRVMSGQIDHGDEVYLLKQGDSPKGIVAHGKVVRGSYRHFQNRDGSGAPSFRVDVEFDVVLAPADEPVPWPLPSQGYPGKFRGPFASGVLLAAELVPALERLWAKRVSTLQKTEVWLTP